MTKKEKNNAELTEKQKKFADLYISDKEFFGNGVQAYIEVYQPDQKKPNWYKTACASASRLLSNDKVIRYISDRLEKTGLNDEFVSKQLLFLITQFTDFSTKLGAIKHYDNLHARIEKARQQALNNKEITKDVIPEVKIIIQKNGTSNDDNILE